ncbi:HlyD family efflux transporter periplasmic adaptor subunit [Sphingobacterium sp. DK4209]|uniref:HlyD family efflux transporter periplasmic adaptor subunit n=1 Tax=Sphingobacterium zhuxiongii TaxID=2662364 RepID=A0A5Q0QAG9_9SPHI|nr:MULTISPECIES: HlyD family efflux transporter periplasmic adaptor subunit [unclassified Sphingobacterium]MVZ65202.1 HlyD family efflux transporter periplasmic adaptor subunit [Sphingobacterium sp. DK4209]QGA26149.1 HlyD family efflux transporter periplasmic adaptor subunit [Sphingobacterium sp. dk4302]
MKTSHTTLNLLCILSLFLLSSCKDKDKGFDATGTFEAIETIISAEAAGTIKAFDVQEGQTLTAGQSIGYIDSVQLYLKKRQLQTQAKALLGKKPSVNTQLAALQSQLATAQRERTRIQNLLRDDAVPAKQLDDINAQIDLISKQVAAQRSTLDLSVSGIDKDVQPIEVQMLQIEDQLQKSKIINPINGTVLTKYAEVNEMASIGKPLYKVADLSNMILRVYISGDQLALVKLNQKVKVFTDDGNKGFKETEGIITWINSKAEFTPKTIQTKNERANQVYAVKVQVKNDGFYKIGMYGEIKLN